jgi:hypothetical protein
MSERKRRAVQELGEDDECERRIESKDRPAQDAAKSTQEQKACSANSAENAQRN